MLDHRLFYVRVHWCYLTIRVVSVPLLVFSHPLLSGREEGERSFHGGYHILSRTSSSDCRVYSHFKESFVDKEKNK